MLSEAMLSSLKALKQVAESGSEVSSESGETRKFFSVITSYSCDVPEAKDRSAAVHGAWRPLPCARCRNTYEDMVKGEESPSRVVAETIEM